MFCVQSVDDSENYDPHPPTPLASDISEDVERLFFSRARVPKEEVEYEEGFQEYNPSFKEVLDFILIRVAGRFTKEELPYFCDELNRDPTYDISEGKDNVYRSTSALRAHLAQWKKRHAAGGMPLSPEDITELQDSMSQAGLTETAELQNSLQSQPAPTGKEVCNMLLKYENPSIVIEKEVGVLEAVFNAVPYETGAKTELPHVIGLLSSSSAIQPKFLTPVMVDTGASISLINYRAFNALGITEAMLDRSYRPCVITAARGLMKSEGFVRTRLHLKNLSGEFPYIKASFLVLDSDAMANVMLGYGELVEREYNIGFDPLHPEEGNALRIAAIDERATRPSRQVIPVIQPSCVKLINVNQILPIEPGMEGSARFQTSHCLPLAGQSTCKLASMDSDVIMPDAEELSNLHPIPLRDVNEHGRSTVSTELTVPIYQTHKTFPPGKLQVYLTDVRTSPISLSEMDLYDLDRSMNREGVSWDQNEAYVMSHISQYPEYFEPPEGDILLPELGHLPLDMRAKFDQMFRANVDSLSQHQFDIGTCTLPPVKIPTNPGVTSQDKPRNYKPGEKKILKNYILDLLDAGIIKKVQEEPAWNHNINLVAKSVDGSQKLDRSGHGMTRQQMLETCGVRFCSDLRGVNEAIPHERMTQLPQFNVMCPLLAAKKLCLFDIRSGYFSVLLDEEAQQIFGFQVDHEYYVYTRLVQGFKNSVAIFQNLMYQVFNEKAWDEYRKSVDCLKYLTFQDTFSIYVDDLVVAAYDLQQLFYCTEFALMCIKRAGLKFHPKKICIDQTFAEVLGFEINTKHSAYKIATKRAAAILQWAFPSNRNAIKSRVASLQYFQQCLPGIKHVIFGLILLAKSKHNKLTFKKLHKLEFMAMRLLVAMEIEMHLPQLDQPLYVSSDASFSTYAGVVMQRRPILDKENKPTGEHTMVVCAAMSKNFKQGDLQRAIYQKETQAMVQTLKSFEYWIRAAIKTVFSTDCIFLAHIANLRHQDSKMFATALFLSAFGTVYFVHSRGSQFLVALSDILSRGLGGSEILSAAGIPKEYLEDRSKLGDPTGMIISPSTLHNVMTAPCPNYTNVPYRKEQRPCPDMIEFDEEHIFNHPTPESEVINAIFGGYEAVKPDTIAFKNNDTQKKMSRTDFAKTESKYKLQNIRQFVQTAAKHQDCKDQKFERVNHVSLYTQDKDFADSMVKQLKEFLQESDRDPEDQQLLNLCYGYLAHEERNHNILRDIIKNFQTSRHFAKEKDPLNIIRYVLAEQAESSEVVLKPEQAAIAICLKEDLHIDVSTVIKLKVWIKFASRYEIEFVEKTPLVAVFANQTDGVLHTWVKNLVLFYTGPQTHVIPAGTKLGEFRFHGEGFKCTCSVPFEKGLLLDTVPDSHFATDDEKGEILDSRVMLFNCVAAVTETALERPVAQTVIKGNLGNVMYPVPSKIDSWSPNRRDLNHILLLSGLIMSGKVLSHDIIRQFQQSCAFLADKRLAVQRGKEREFVERDGLLFKKKTVLGEEVLLLCLDGVTYGFLASSLHQRGYHFSLNVILAYLGNMFFAVNAKDAIKRAQANCGPCFWTQRCFRRNAVVANNEKPAIGARWSSDLIENLERDKYGHKYLCLLIETRTTFCLTIPLKTTQSKEFAQKLEPYLPIMMASEFVSDFGTLYRGPELKKLLAKYNITHNKSVPQRPQQNGLSEVTAKEVRAFFRAFLTGMPGNARAYWSSHLYFATTLYNCGIIYSGDQQLTRYNLFHNADRSVNRQFLTALNGVSSQNIYLQEESMKLIDRRREKARESYSASGLRQYEPGQLVMLVSNKAEMQKASPSSGLEPNSVKMYRVLGTTDSGLGVRCESLMNGDKQTFENAKLMPVNSDMLLTGFGFDPVASGSFDASLFRRGNGNFILQTLKNNHEDLFPPELPAEEEEPDTAMDEGAEEDIPMEVTDDHPDENAEDYNARPGYNLRPRPTQPSVYCVQLGTKGILKRKRSKVFRQGASAKRLRFDNEVTVVPIENHGSEEAMCPVGAPLELLPAFSRDLPRLNYMFAIPTPVEWTPSGVKPAL